MPANTSPIFALTSNTPTGLTILTANTAKDGTGAVVTSLTGGANGTLVKGITFRGIGTNTATVARIFINNGLTNATPANNSLFGEITLPATTLSETGALATQVWMPDVPNFVLPTGYKLNVTIGTTVAAGYAIQAIGGDY